MENHSFVCWSPALPRPAWHNTLGVLFAICCKQSFACLTKKYYVCQPPPPPTRGAGVDTESLLYCSLRWPPMRTVAATPTTRVPWPPRSSTACQAVHPSHARLIGSAGFSPKGTQQRVTVTPVQRKRCATRRNMRCCCRIPPPPTQSSCANASMLSPTNTPAPRERHRARLPAG